MSRLLLRVLDRVTEIPPARLRLLALTALACACSAVIAVVASNNPKQPAPPKPPASTQKAAVDGHPNYTELSGKRAPAAVWLGPPRDGEALFRDETYKDRSAFIYVNTDDAARIDGGLAPLRATTVIVEATDGGSLAIYRKSMPRRNVPVPTGIPGVRAHVDPGGTTAYIYLTRPHPLLVTVSTPDPMSLRSTLKRLVISEAP